MPITDIKILNEIFLTNATNIYLKTEMGGAWLA